MRSPEVVPIAGLPAAVTVYEVGPRDGLQNEPGIVPTQEKVAFAAALLAAGLPYVEATAFVPPTWVPKLADADAVIAGLAAGVEGVGARVAALVPNERGLDRALAAGVEHVAVFASATESFARRNLNRGYDEQWAMFAPTMARARANGLRVRGYVSMCFGDPWEGAVRPARVVQAALRLLDLGADELSVGDTIGVATTGQVEGLVAALVGADVPIDAVALHFHDTYGQALANVVAGLRCGVATFDAAAGGLGGCPYAGSATGNLATEDLVWLLDGLGIDTGVDLAAVVRASSRLADVLGRPNPSKAWAALAGVADATEPDSTEPGATEPGATEQKAGT